MTEMVILRLVHIVAGAVWVGVATFAAFLLVPVLSTLGPGAGPVVEGLRGRGLFVLMPTLAILTVLTGVRLLWIVSGGLSPGWLTTPMGMTYAGAAVLALIAFVGGLVSPKPPPPAVTKVLAVLLLLSAAGMAVARYLG